MTKQELRFAQKDIYNAGNYIATAGLRLRDTEFDKAYLRLYNALNSLNNKLIKEINKK